MSKLQARDNRPTRSWFHHHPVWTGLLTVLAILLLILVLLSLLPVKVNDASVSDPAASHEEALARIETIRAAEEESGKINPVCLTNVMSHGEKTERVIVFLHGFTSCPEQFREIGEQFFAQGYNVYIPRLPYHGHLDRLSDALLETSAEELAAFATASIDIAHGLGDKVVVGGLSGGGTIAAWIAQAHRDVDQAVMVAPFLGIGFVPTLVNRPVARILDEIPNIWMWWDPISKADNPKTASYAYPRYPLHALTEYLQLGFAAAQAAQETPPGANSIVVITNANDSSVDNGLTMRLVSYWQAHGEESLDTIQFAEELNLPHDMITPDREDGNPGLVYPIIIESISVPAR